MAQRHRPPWQTISPHQNDVGSKQATAAQHRSCSTSRTKTISASFQTRSRHFSRSRQQGTGAPGISTHKRHGASKSRQRAQKEKQRHRQENGKSAGITGCKLQPTTQRNSVDRQVLHIFAENSLQHVVGDDSGSEL
jgi:hypothetical protein